MKSHLSCALCLVVVLCSAAPMLAQNSLDISLEGPWIYYQDPSFLNSAGKSVPVLIAMAPAVAHHHDPTFSTGEGFPFSAGLWCVGFDSKCGPNSSSNTLTSGTSPGLQLVPVRSLPGWHWYSNRDPNAWYVILPMPDSATNDGLNNMKLGTTYATYLNGEVQHTIGLRLHYTSGATRLDLYSCGAPTGDNCPNPRSRGWQANSGTLRITIKYDEDPTDHCDQHVRDAYNKTILFLDPTDLALSVPHNVNQDKAYVDLPQDDGSYDASCYLCDPQNPTPTCFQLTMSGPRRPVEVNQALRQIVDDLRNLHRDNDQLYLAELSKEEESLHGNLPTFSQLPGMEQLLNLSTNAVHSLFLKLSVNNEAGAKTKPALQANPLLPKLHDIEAEEQVLRDYLSRARSGTSGKDCRAAQMQMQ